MKGTYLIHNPRCSKSRATLELLKTKGIEPQIIDYLKGELTRDFLVKTLKALNASPTTYLRTKEEVFSSLNLDLDNQDQKVEAILKHPIILERPILIKDGKAALGRPPENILSIL